MNVDQILATMNRHGVAYLLLGGVHFLLRHAPVLTYDIDLWIEDTPANCERCEKALGDLCAEWGASSEDWSPVAAKIPGWLRSQAVFCLTSPHGPIDIFRYVKGLDSWVACRARGVEQTTSGGVPYVGLSDEDMLRCQMALPEEQRKPDRIRILKQALGEAGRE
jgi:hypothetical protein